MSGSPNYCPDCGTALEGRRIEGRERRYCDRCERPVYRNPKPCSGVLVVDGQDRTLLVKRTEPPAAGSWSVPAGYLEADEPAPAAAIRELGEETGLIMKNCEEEVSFKRRSLGPHRVTGLLCNLLLSLCSGEVELFQYLLLEFSRESVYEQG